MIWLRTLMPVNQIYMLVILFIYSLISIDVVFWITPLVAFYIALGTIIISTMQMFYTRRKLHDVRALADMLQRFSETFSQDSAESSYSWSSLTPYVSFFIAIPFLVITFSLADKTWIPCSELACISLVITIACLFALSDKYDYLAVLSILLDNISTLPVFIAGVPKIPVLYHILQIFAGVGLSVELLPEFYLQIGIPSLAYLIVPLLFLRMAMRKSWTGTYQILVPHLVCFLWWRVVVMFYIQSTWFGLLRASVGWVVFVVLMPVLAISCFFWIGFLVFEAFSISSLIKIATTLVLLSAVGVFAYWSRGGFRLGQFSLEKKSAKTNLLLTLILLLSCVPLAYIILPEETGQKSNYLPWDVYQKHCGRPKWESSIVAQAMVDCSHFAEAKVNWTGTVKQIVVKHVENQAESFISSLPAMLSDWLRCTYGDEYIQDCEKLPNELDRDACQYNRLQGRNCHLKNLNRYTFELTVVVADDEIVRLSASHWFQQAILLLRPGDLVLFRAFLKDNLGNTGPILKLYNLQCTNCDVVTTTVLQRNQWNILLQLKYAVQNVWNFFLAPVVMFKTFSS